MLRRASWNLRLRRKNIRSGASPCRWPKNFRPARKQHMKMTAKRGTKSLDRAEAQWDIRMVEFEMLR